MEFFEKYGYYFEKFKNKTEKMFVKKKAKWKCFDKF